MKSKPFIVLLFLFIISTGLISAQTIKADEIRQFEIFNSDTVWMRQPFDKKFNFTGHYQVYRRQYYTIKKVKNSLQIDSTNRILEIKDTIFSKIQTDFPLLEGFYCKGKPTGKWLYYHDYGTNYSFCTQIYIDYTVLYKKDSIIRESILPNKISRIVTDKNATFVKGYLIINDLPVNIDCKKSKNECLIWTKRKLNIIKKFNFDLKELAKTRLEIENGDYNRLIKNYH